jgi:hypothetical protein
MSAPCHPISRALAGAMLRRLVDSICDRPGATAMSQAAWEDEVVDSVVAFGPRDAVEFMLAGMIVSNYQLMLDATHDAFAGGANVPRGRGNPGVIALERAVTGLLKELRIAQTRPLAEETQVSAQQVRTQPADDATPKPETKAASPPRPDEPPSRPPALTPMAPAAMASKFDQTIIDAMKQCTETLGPAGNSALSAHSGAGLNPGAVSASTARARAGAEREPVG